MYIHPEQNLQRQASQQNISKIDWTSIYAEIQKCKNYEELEVLVDSLNESSFDDQKVTGTGERRMCVG